jgi:hypothetical protein
MMHGFRKMDEMEKDIALKSEKITLMFAKICLIAWCIYIFAAQGVQELVFSWPFILLLSTAAVQLGSTLILTNRISKGKKDEE